MSIIEKLLQKFDKESDVFRHEYLPSFKDRLKRHGNEVIVDLKICRTPLPSGYKLLLNLTTDGKFNERMTALNHDDVYHLFLLVTLKDGTELVLEKNQNLNLIPYIKRQGNTRCLTVNLQERDLTLNELLGNALEQNGTEKFFDYSAKNNNCSDFINMVLAASQLSTDQTSSFITQDAAKLLEGFPDLRKFLNTVTRAASLAEVYKENIVSRLLKRANLMSMDCNQDRKRQLHALMHDSDAKVREIATDKYIQHLKEMMSSIDAKVEDVSKNPRIRSFVNQYGADALGEVSPEMNFQAFEQSMMIGDEIEAADEDGDWCKGRIMLTNAGKFSVRMHDGREYNDVPAARIRPHQDSRNKGLLSMGAPLQASSDDDMKEVDNFIRGAGHLTKRMKEILHCCSELILEDNVDGETEGEIRIKAEELNEKLKMNKEYILELENEKDMTHYDIFAATQNISRMLKEGVTGETYDKFNELDDSLEFLKARFSNLENDLATAVTERGELEEDIMVVGKKLTLTRRQKTFQQGELFKDAVGIVGKPLSCTDVPDVMGILLRLKEHFGIIGDEPLPILCKVGVFNNIGPTDEHMFLQHYYENLSSGPVSLVNETALRYNLRSFGGRYTNTVLTDQIESVNKMIMAGYSPISWSEALGKPICGAVKRMLREWERNGYKTLVYKDLYKLFGNQDYRPLYMIQADMPERKTEKKEGRSDSSSRKEEQSDSSSSINDIGESKPMGYSSRDE